MPSKLHEDLAALAAKWVKRQGFSVIATDLSALGCAERADVIGFRSQCSIIIESKVSRGDFLADAKKPMRAAGGVGLYRFYVCPPGLIRPEELPRGWGLLYGSGKQIEEVVRPRGNIWPGPETTLESWSPFQHEFDRQAERGILFSIARRLSAGKTKSQ